jgi:cell surface protein SprA
LINPVRKKNILGFIGRFISRVLLSLIVFPFTSQFIWAQDPERVPSDTTTGTGLRYPIHESNNYPFSNSGTQSPLLLKPPSNIHQEIEYDPVTGQYVFTEKVGELNYRPPSSMTLNEYMKYDAGISEKEYWREKSLAETGAGPSFMKNLRLGSQSVDKVFGTDVINIVPKGSAELMFGYSYSTDENPNGSERSRKSGSFLFQPKIMVNVTGSIGDKMEVGINYNTEATFDFENKTKLEYSGKEDEIIKKIEAGDVKFTLPGSLITGSQSLFGLKTELQFGHLTVTSVVGNQKGASSSINVQGGAQLTEFEVNVDQYDVNRHFFLAQFFRDHYTEWLSKLPYIESQLQIQQLEVWVVNKQNDYTQVRNIVAFMDLAEGYADDGSANFYSDADLIQPYNRGDQPADNSLNALYGKMADAMGTRSYSDVEAAISRVTRGDYSAGSDYVTLESARPLNDREYSLNKELGYISLNSPLRNDEVLAVAFTFTYRGKTYQVGDISSQVEAPGVLILKLLKGTTSSPKYPMWDLMMKNVYSIGAYQLSAEKFVMNIFYRSDKTGVPVNYISESDTSTISSFVQKQPLLKVLGLDNMDTRNEPNPDGVFDYVEGVTINSKNGRIYFPLLEPFGSDLRDKIIGTSNDIEHQRTANKYVFQELYDSTQTRAEQIAEKNKFLLKGQYQSSSSSEIQLNATMVPKGSVVVTAGGQKLTENVDYTVDYTLGRVKIINQGLLESGTPIRISLETNQLFDFQTKTLLGTHLDYKFSENFNVGATIMHLKEIPLTKKVNMGDEPISNTIWGLNTAYRTQSQILTTIIDKLPFLETKQPSSISFEGEFAQLIPGQVKDINGVAYIDDFEAAQTKIEMKSPFNWYLSSAPRKNPDFVTADMDSLKSGFGRAKLAWYAIDHLFYREGYGLNPGNDAVNTDLQSHYARSVVEKEIFPTRENAIPGTSYLSILNMAFYPDERGPYNFDPVLTDDAKLPNPKERWGGVMRDIVSSDFETSNIEFIEFWLMDPYLEDTLSAGGDMYIHLGEISEDILRDSRKMYEGGLPTDPDNIENVDTTIWGRVPTDQAFLNTFVEDQGKELQDAGLDGLVDRDEQTFFDPYLKRLTNLNSTAKSQITADPSADDFMYFLDPQHDALDHGIFDRYKNYSNLEGNAPPVNNPEDYIPSNSNTPDIEDINGDNTMNGTETYFQYKISLRPEDIDEVGKNNIVDQIVANIDGFEKPARWIQFRVPLGEWESKVGDIEDFRSIRFMRLMLSGFERKVYLRFATLDLVRADWRRYNYDLSETNPAVTEQSTDGEFEVSAVNYEENSKRTPVNYILPPDITRATDYNTQQLVQENEQSLSLKVKGLEDGDARSVFKNVQLDFRQYSRIKMFIHAEALPGMEGTISDQDLNAFVRIGSDYQNNYYEIEVPLRLTAPGVYDEDEEKEIVWPVSNNIELILDELIALKRERNERVQNDPLNYSSQNIYTRLVDSVNFYIIKVKGNPNLANIRQIMIGIRNPGDASSYGRINDGLPKSAEIWFNELRLAEFNNRGGWAANGRVQAQLADFGVVNLAGSKSTPGFGSIEEKVAERSTEETNQYDISSNLELGKFFPEKASVSIPLYLGASKTIINPEYFPKDPDIKLQDLLDAIDSQAERDSIKRISQDFTSRASINITNMRWNKKIKKFDIISPANLTATLGYTQTRARNYSTEYNNLWKYNASLNYVFNARPKNIQPFKKAKGFKKPAYRIIRDLNFNPYPSRFTFGTIIDRNYQEIKMRNVYEDVELLIEPTVSKDFTWDRKYDLKWDLARGLKLDYSATNTARIDEPYGQQDLFKANNEIWKDSVWNSMREWGRNMNFIQKTDLSYTVPINKIPLFNWMSVTTSYGTTYNWIVGEMVPGREDLGNTLKNSNNIKVSSNLNLKSLYSKLTYLKNLESKYNQTKNKDTDKDKEDESRFKTVQYEKRTFFKKDEPKNIVHKLNTEEVEVSVLGADGNKIDVNTTIVNANKIVITSSQDLTNVNVVVTGKIPKGQNPLILIADNTMRLLTGFKTVNISWNRSSGSVIPGFLPESKLFGFDTKDYYGAPGWPFVFGMQDTGIVRNFIDNGWITNSNTLSKPFEYNRRDELNLRASFEPYNGLRVDLSGLRSYSEYSEQIFFRDDSLGLANYHNNEYFVDNRYNGGSFSISVITILTAFEKQNTKNEFASAAFNRLRNNRPAISERRYHQLLNRLVDNNNQVYTETSDGFYDGFGPTSQDVLVPAFLAAYTGTDPKNVTLNSFFWNIMPNWKITYDGLSEIGFIQKVVKNITITHSYKSVYSITGFGTNVSFFDSYDAGSVFIGSGDGSDDLRNLIRDNQDNYISQYQYSSVSIKEQMSPLIGFDMTFNNSLLTKIELGKTRMISMSLNNNQVNESRNTDYTLGAGYRIKEVPLTIKSGGSKKQIKSDLNIRFDATLRDNITIIRVLTSDIVEQGSTSITTGTKKLTLGLTADYVFSDKFNIQFFFDREVNTPHTNLSYRTTETSGGFILKLTL